ncbi:hypothetical protein [Streptomyces minutiscleroticus]|uniref:Uncharacterized protein n=1 Tax=Streptomyces minutiscleroticus TaxID=68238 RepID=A0A918N8F3_9ACTN|nr:hypothetical protein [Streptomyces minutiscleroticus]GGX53690.1 hypothetical protein GCM10010358_04530 [Streptomyces minutiscleroticus]
MGWTVLYIAFGIVALWLLGEVLLQYKARLRWRLLAFVGFLGVVVGVLIPSVPVIGLGAAAFAVGQTYVTLSFRRGFSTGWALKNGRGGGAPSKRRRGGDRRDPTLEVSGLEVSDPGAADAGTYRHDPGHDDVTADDDNVFAPAQRTSPEAGATTVYEPQPMPDDTNQYGVYSDAAYAAATDPSYAPAGRPSDGRDHAYDGYAGGYDPQQQYGYDAGQQQYAGYTDPYGGGQGYDGGSYDGTGQQQYGQQGYGQQGYGQDQYGDGTGAEGYGETPPGGLWVPQQRGAQDQYGGELPAEQPYPYQDGHTYDDRQQYRY